MTFTGVKCDVCERIKGPTNGWFKLVSGGVCLEILPHHVHYEPINDDKVHDICGEACLVKKLSELLPGLHSEQAGAMGREI